MKKISTLFLVITTLTLSITSCSSDNSNLASIEGKWEFYQEGTIVNGKEILDDITENSPCGKDYLQFLKGGALNDFSFDQSSSDCTKPVETGIWIKTDNSLKLTYTSAAVNDYEILELSNSILKVKEIDVSGVYILVFKRK